MREKVEKYEFIYDVPPEERENNKRLQNLLKPNNSEVIRYFPHNLYDIGH